MPMRQPQCCGDLKRLKFFPSNNWGLGFNAQLAEWKDQAGTPAVVKWAPRRLMFASASNVLAFWIPDLSKLTPT